MTRALVQESQKPSNAAVRRIETVANWCNARLIVVGQRPDVVELSRHARSRPSSLFEPDMLEGEGQDLFAERMETLGRGLSKKKYVFQVRNDDGHDHFREISRRYRSLWFVLAYHDPNSGEFGSYFIRQGRSRVYLVPEDVITSVMSTYGVDYDSDDEENECRFWEASWAVIDMAESRWLPAVLKKATTAAGGVVNHT